MIQYVYLIFRRRPNRRYPHESKNGAYEYHPKGYGDIPVSERDNMKASEQAGIPSYIRNWNKHDSPYISSPTLLTGEDTACDLDISRQLPYRGRSSSAGNETQVYDVDPVHLKQEAEGKRIL